MDVGEEKSLKKCMQAMRADAVGVGVCVCVHLYIYGSLLFWSIYVPTKISHANEYTVHTKRQNIYKKNFLPTAKST